MDRRQFAHNTTKPSIASHHLRILHTSSTLCRSVYFVFVCHFYWCSLVISIYHFEQATPPIQSPLVFAFGNALSPVVSISMPKMQFVLILLYAQLFLNVSIARFCIYFYCSNLMVFIYFGDKFTVCPIYHILNLFISSNGSKYLFRLYSVDCGFEDCRRW